MKPRQSGDEEATMIPEEFRISAVREDGGVLRGLFFCSESLRNAVKDGAMPPLHVFDAFMACGIDDVPDEIGLFDLDVKQIPGGGTMEWEPFELTEKEYESLLRHIRSLGHEFEVKDFGVSTYQEWFNELFKQSDRNS